MNLIDSPNFFRERRMFQYCDDFLEYATGNRWTTNKTAVGGEGVAVSATQLGGQVVLTTGGTASNEAGFYSTVKAFKAAASAPLEFECALQYVDANNHDCGLFFGFSDVLASTGASGPLTAAAAAFKSSFTGFGFGKFAGDTKWRVISSATTTQLSNQTSNACDDASGSALHRFGIRVYVVSSTLCEAVFLIDGAQCLDATTLLPIKHSLAFNSTAFYAGALAKAGGANSQTPGIDYLYAAQELRSALK